MTTDKPASGWAMDAAKDLTENLSRYINPALMPSVTVKEMAAIIQAAINEATAAVVAERDGARNKYDMRVEQHKLTRRERDEARAAARERIDQGE